MEITGVVWQPPSRYRRHHHRIAVSVADSTASVITRPSDDAVQVDPRAMPVSPGRDPGTARYDSLPVPLSTVPAEVAPQGFEGLEVAPRRDEYPGSLANSSDTTATIAPRLLPAVLHGLTRE